MPEIDLSSFAASLRADLEQHAGRTVRIHEDGTVTGRGSEELLEFEKAELCRLYPPGAYTWPRVSDVPVQVTSGRNPFAKQSWNLTEQIKMAMVNPSLAAQLRQNA